MSITVYQTTQEGQPSRHWIAVPSTVTGKIIGDEAGGSWTFPIQSGLGAVTSNTDVTLVDADERALFSLDLAHAINRLLGALNDVDGAALQPMSERELRDTINKELDDHVIFEVVFAMSYEIAVDTIVLTAVNVPDGEGGSSEENYSNRQPSPLGQKRALFKVDGGYTVSLPIVFDESSGPIVELTSEDVFDFGKQTLENTGGITDTATGEEQYFQAVATTRPSGLGNDYDPLSMSNYKNKLTISCRQTDRVLDDDLADYTAIANDDATAFIGFTNVT